MREAKTGISIALEISTSSHSACELKALGKDYPGLHMSQFYLDWESDMHLAQQVRSLRARMELIRASFKMKSLRMALEMVLFILGRSNVY